MNNWRPGPRALALVGTMALVVLAAVAQPAGAKGFFQQGLISDQAGAALHTDLFLVNSWGIGFGPTGLLWVADNGTGVATVYEPEGEPIDLIVTIPPPAGSTATAAPTGLVHNPTGDFVVTKNGVSGAARFLFATEDGTISGWNPDVDPTHAILAVDRSAEGAVYKGITLAETETGNFLYATDFHNGQVDMFDQDFNLVNSFTDSTLPAGFAPFNVHHIDGRLFVTFAKQQPPDNRDDQAGPGNGFVVIFDTQGNCERLFAAHGALNSPWGMMVAPPGFGELTGALLVGNFGDGRVNVFSLRTGAFKGQMTNRQGQPIVIDGLWGLALPPMTVVLPPRQVYFASGPDDESHGLVGTLRRAVALGRFPPGPGAAQGRSMLLR